MRTRQHHTALNWWQKLVRSAAFARLTREQDQGLRTIVSIVHCLTKDDETCAEWWPRFIAHLKATRDAYTELFGPLEWEEGEAALLDMGEWAREHVPVRPTIPH